MRIKTSDKGQQMTIVAQQQLERSALLIIISTFTTKAMLKPLKKVNRELSRIASGDFSKRSHPHSKDEFGTLISNINKLSDDLTHLIKAISNDAHELDKKCN